MSQKGDDYKLKTLSAESRAFCEGNEIEFLGLRTSWLAMILQENVEPKKYGILGNMPPAAQLIRCAPITSFGHFNE